MSRFDRIYKIHELLKTARHPVPMRRFTAELEATRNTVTRDFEYLRDTLGAPLEYCREHNGHRYNPGAPVFELPGFWLSPGELHALLACEQLLENVQPGLIANRLAPLRDRVRKLLGESGHAAEQINRRVQVQPLQVRGVNSQVFDPVAEATLSQRCLRFRYQGRSGDPARERTVHPQRLLYYRSNWYLLAVCDDAGQLRLFSLDRISEPACQDRPSESLSDTDLDAFAASSFGIFGGAPTATAHLRFTPHAAQWVAEETWHPNQQAQWQGDGFHLWVPYSDSRELVMEILRYGPEVEVIGPEDLRGKVVERIRKMQGIYC
ncbi:MAG: WYL domain-containing protein [Marinobacter sp.]|nr:WYL domain-containing protein [Marinobacter sp.]